MDRLLNIFRRWWQKRVEKQFRKCLEDEAAENFLGLLLKLMALALKVDRDFQRNIVGFKGALNFRSADNSVTVGAVFTGKELKVKKGLVPDADISVIFKDSRALLNYLLAQDRDILKLLLNNEVVLQGNVNYMLKFGYMSNHLQLALARKLPGV